MAIPIDVRFPGINWEALLLNSNIQRGGSLIGYVGLPYQRGYGLGSFFRSLFRIAAPVTKKILKSVTREGVKTAAAIGSDLLEGRNIKESLKAQGKSSGKRLLRKGIESLQKLETGNNQEGGQIGLQKRRKKGQKRKIGYVRSLTEGTPVKKARKVPRKKSDLVKKADFLGEY